MELLFQKDIQGLETRSSLIAGPIVLEKAQSTGPEFPVGFLLILPLQAHETWLSPRYQSSALTERSPG
jgi:hypothetical protein